MLNRGLCPHITCPPGRGRAPDNCFRVLFLSDTHLGHDLPVRATKRLHRGADFFRNTRRALRHALDPEAPADLVIHGGDLFFRSKIPAPIVRRGYDLLLEFLEAFPGHLLLLPGNHERSRLPPDIALNHPRLHTVADPTTIHLEYPDLRLAVDMLPAIYDDARGQLPELLQKFDRSTPVDLRLLVIHQAVDGCCVENFTFRNRPDTFRREDLPRDVELILAGHIHRQQILPGVMDMPAIHYAGSVERTSFQELHEDKACQRLTFHNLENSWKHKKTEILTLPSRPMIKLSWMNCGQLVEKWISELMNRLDSLPCGAQIRLYGVDFDEFSSVLPEIKQKASERGQILLIQGKRATFSRVKKYDH